MKKVLALALLCIMVVSMLSVTAFAAPANNAPKYYDQSGNRIYGNDYYYNDNSVPMFGGNCYYMNGKTRNYVADMQAYMYDADGKLAAADYFYDANGNPIDPADMNTNGWYNCYWGYNNSGGYGGGRRCCGW